jgi:DNA helicase-2/ATP-dependent DNA helicase PcrA
LRSIRVLLKDLYEDKSVEGLNRYENIQELLNGIKEFSEREDIEEKGLDVFMQDIALLTNDDKDKNKDADTVSLMTIHSSKGLEFPQVFVVGLEENLFPSQMSLNSRSDLEEERRLFYVAVTRAERKLSISYATSRFKFGTLINCEPSRFLDEIDARYLELDFRPNRRKARFLMMSATPGAASPIQKAIPFLSLKPPQHLRRLKQHLYWPRRMWYQKISGSLIPATCR